MSFKLASGPLAVNCFAFGVVMLFPDKGSTHCITLVEFITTHKAGATPKKIRCSEFPKDTGHSFDMVSLQGRAPKEVKSPSEFV